MSATPPLNRPTLPLFHTSSILRSPRNSDDVRRQHLKTSVMTAQNAVHAEAVRQLKTAINRLRLRSSPGLPVAATQFIFFSDEGDYIVVTPQAGGKNVNMAKPPKIRCSITSETYVDGTGVHTFTYAPIVVSSITVGYERTNTWSAGVQTELVTPAYLPGDLICGIFMGTIQMPTALASETTVGVSLLDIHDKDWADLSD